MRASGKHDLNSLVYITNYTIQGNMLGLLSANSCLQTGGAQQGGPGGPRPPLVLRPLPPDLPNSKTCAPLIGN